MTSPNIRRLSFYNTEVATEHYLGIRWPRRIWESVLMQAIDDIVQTDPFPYTQAVMEDLRAAAQSWVDDPVNEPRRFVWVCEQLNLDPTAVRTAIIKRKELK